MFTPEELTKYGAMFDEVLHEVENEIFKAIIERLKANATITSVTDWQINKLYEFGVLNSEIREVISTNLNYTDEQIEEMYSEIAEKDYIRNAQLYKASDVAQVPIDKNESLKQTIQSVTAHTNGTIKNISKSMGFAVRNKDNKIEFTQMADYYQKTLDKAVIEMTTGASDYNTILKRTVSEMSNSGIRTVDYASGHNNRIEVAVRRAVMTSTNQIVAEINNQTMEDLDTRYVETSYHSGARKEHQKWQGQVFEWKNRPTRNKSSKATKNNVNTVAKGEESGIIKSEKAIELDIQRFAEKDIPKQESKSLKKALKNYQKRIDEHKLKISNPKEYVANWENYDERKKQGLKKHWQKEIDNFEKSISDRIVELDKRGDYNE